MKLEHLQRQRLKPVYTKLAVDAFGGICKTYVDSVRLLIQTFFKCSIIYL
jgi:hypothetical protein